MKRTFCLFCTFVLLAQPSTADCVTREIGALVSSLVAESGSENSRLIRLIIEDVDDAGTKGAPEVIVLTEEVLRGGSASQVLVDIYPGRSSGVCSAPLFLALEMNPSAPFAISFQKTDTEGVPNIKIEYEFEDDNSFGSYETSSKFVADERIETYVANETEYELTSQKILRCIECPSGIVATPEN